MNNSVEKSKKIAVQGLLLALTVIFVFMASSIPGLELTFYAVAGITTGIGIIESNIKGGMLIYIAVIILSFVIVPNKIGILPYVFCFGIYGFLKQLCEKSTNLIIQLLSKTIVFIIISAIALIFFKELLLGNISIPDFLPTWTLGIIAIVMFFLYDYIFTLAINIYNQRVRRNKINIKLTEEEDEKR